MNMRTMFLPSNLHLVALLFKDEGGGGGGGEGGGFSQASLDLSPSRGVWMVRKCKKVKEKGEKNHTDAGGQETWRPILLID